jgi:hypothetical protein
VYKKNIIDMGNIKVCNVEELVVLQPYVDWMMMGGIVRHVWY